MLSNWLGAVTNKDFWGIVVVMTGLSEGRMLVDQHWQEDIAQLRELREHLDDAVELMNRHPWDHDPPNRVDADRSPAALPALTGKEEIIMEAIGDGRMKAQEIADKAGYENGSSFRASLSNLVKRGILEKIPRIGYRRRK